MEKTEEKQEKVGVVTHYYSKLGVGIIKLERGLSVGDKVKFKGSTTDFEQAVAEMQLEHKGLDAGKKGQEVGVKVTNQVRDGDEVYLIN